MAKHRKTRSERESQQQQRAVEGAAAMAEYQAAQAATREKTARLRALRLAKETERSKPKSKAAPKARR